MEKSQKYWLLRVATRSFLLKCLSVPFGAYGPIRSTAQALSSSVKNLAVSG